MKIDKKEVEYKEKAGTAWSHSYLNQKPWHPLSYPNQRRKWIAEQTHAQKEERTAEVAREFAQEQEFFRQTAQMSKKEKEKMEVMQAVSFMYMRPPGYNAEAARAAEIADEKKRLGLTTTAVVDATPDDGNTSTAVPPRKAPRVKDVFGRTLPTEEEFPSLKNAPRHDTGAPTRVKPFAIEIRNVKCARCGAFGHQSGDRECPLKDVVMPSEEARLIREDPLNVILAQTGADELLTWELKQKPGGLSPARGGFKPDHPNQQIIPDEDIYDEYGGFLPGGGGDEGTLSIPNLLASLSHEQRKELTDVKSKKKRKHRKQRKIRRKDKGLDSRKSANSSHHYPERDGQRDDRKFVISSEDEQRYLKSRTSEADISQDEKTTLLRKDESSDSNGGDQGTPKGMGRKGLNFHLNDQKSEGSSGRRTSDKIVDSTNNRLDMYVEYQRGKRRKNTYREGDTRTDSDDEPSRLRYNNRRDAIDDEHRGARFKENRESSDAEQRMFEHEGRSDSNADEQRRGRYKNSGHDEPRRGRYKSQIDITDDNQRRLGRNNCRSSSDGKQTRLRHKHRRDSSDDEQKTLSHRHRRDSNDDEQKRLRHTSRRDSSGDEQKTLRHMYRRDSSDDEQNRLRHTDRRDSSDDEQKTLRHKYRRDSSDDEQKRFRHKDRSDEEQRLLRHSDRKNGRDGKQRRLSQKKKGRSDDDEQVPLRHRDARDGND